MNFETTYKIFKKIDLFLENLTKLKKGIKSF